MVATTRAKPVTQVPRAYGAGMAILYTHQKSLFFLKLLMLQLKILLQVACTFDTKLMGLRAVTVGMAEGGRMEETEDVEPHRHVRTLHFLSICVCHANLDREMAVVAGMGELVVAEGPPHLEGMPPTYGSLGLKPV